MKNIIIILSLVLFCITFPLSARPDKPCAADTVSTFDKAPEVRHRVEPKYPEPLLKDGWEATLFIKVCVDVDGNVVKTSVDKISISSSNAVFSKGEEASRARTGKEFQESALTALKQWKFEPAQLQGKPVNAWVTIPFRFRVTSDNDVLPGVYRVLKENVGHILQGTDTEISKEFVSKKADLIFGNKSVNLLDVLNGKYPKINLVEGNGTVCLQSDIHSFGAGTAFIIWKSKPPKGASERFHTIQLLNTTENVWKIVHWHVSW